MKYYRPSFSCTDIAEEECAILASKHDNHDYCFENLFAREKCCVCHGGKQDFVDTGKLVHFSIDIGYLLYGSFARTFLEKKKKFCTLNYYDVCFSSWDPI